MSEHFAEFRPNGKPPDSEAGSTKDAIQSEKNEKSIFQGGTSWFPHAYSECNSPEQKDLETALPITVQPVPWKMRLEVLN